MTTFQRLRKKMLASINAIDNYENAFAGSITYPEKLINELRTNAAREVAELAQMISNAAKVTETITEQ